MIKPIGHFRIHRELYNKPIWKLSTPEQKVVLMTLLAMAWFKPNEWEWKGQKFKTVPGQFVTSLQSIVDDCGKGISIQNVRSSLKRFEKLEFLTNESTKEGRLITIANWELYQYSEDKPTKLPTKGQQRVNKDPTPKEESNNVNNEIIKDIVLFLNSICGTKYKSSGKKTKDLIKARLNEGFTLEDFKKVIKIKSEEWLNTHMSKFLRPETLFSNKFESYLNQKPTDNNYVVKKNGFTNIDNREMPSDLDQRFIQKGIGNK